MLNAKTWGQKLKLGAEMGYMGKQNLAHIQGSIINFLQSGSPIIFFSHIKGSDIFFKKKHIPPMEIQWGVP